MNYDYFELLRKAKKGLPDLRKGNSRFELPKAIVEIVGRQTTIKNFSDIAKILRRDPRHMIKFLFKELAIPGDLRNDELVLQGKIDENMINKKIEDYVKEFVLCKECGKADTIIEKREKMPFIKCEACGASRPLRS